MITEESPSNLDVVERECGQEARDLTEPIAAEVIAEYLLCLFHQKGEEINDLRLQKLLYYIQAWHLALYEEPLFSDRFEAWIDGPVIPHLNGRFNEYAWKPITYLPAECPDLPEEVREHIDEVLGVYGHYTAEDLEYLVHRSNPWIIARGSLRDLDPGHTLIDEEEMMKFYQRMGRED